MIAVLLLYHCQLKKIVIEGCDEILFGQNEDWQHGDSTSGESESLSKRVGREDQCCDLVKGLQLIKCLLQKVFC